MRSSLFPSSTALATSCFLLAGSAAAQAEVVADLVAGPSGSAGDAMASFQGKVYFAAGQPGVGSELFVATGPKSASLFKDLFPGKTGNFTNSSAPTGFCEFRGRLYFAATFAGVGREVGVTDGTVAGTKLFVDAWSTSSSSPTSFTVAGGQMFFFGRTSSVTLGLFVTDGTVAGTRLLRHFGGQGLTSIGRIGTGASGRVFFGAQSGAGVELWESDGTVLGTKVFKDLAPGSKHSWPGGFAQLGTKTLFAASTVPGKRWLWVSDGTALGTSPVGSPVSVTSPLVVLKGAVYFEGHTGDGDREIWKTDGTLAGTRRVVDVRPGAYGSEPDWLTPVAGKWLYFTAQVFDGRGRELWRTDGTARGTLQVAEVYPGAQSGSPRGDKARNQLVERDGHVYFYATNHLVGTELFAVRTDAATSYREGAGCGAKATLAATFPKLGGTMTLTGTRAPTPMGLLAVGLPAATPVAIGGGCLLRVDLGTGLVLAGVATGGTGTWSLGVAVPAASGFVGEVFELQMAFASGAGGTQLTNGMRVMIGR